VGRRAPAAVNAHHATIVRNEASQGASVFVDGVESSVRVGGSIVSAMAATEDCMAIDGTIESYGYNVGGDRSCGLAAVGDQVGVDPLIGQLLDNGGKTLTHALLSGSPAMDAADISACPPADQRGAPRPYGTGCDVGAFEAGAAPPLEPPSLIPEFPYVPPQQDPPPEGFGCSWPRTVPGVPTETATTTTIPPSNTPEPPKSETPTRPITTPTSSPKPTAVPACVCGVVSDRVPPVVVADALANPQRYYGWQYPLNPGVPPGPGNPLRECLSLANIGLDYHPIWNKPMWRVGCP
jgi:hypothetical protein